MNENISLVHSSLTSIPYTDCNYISALQRATDSELQEAIRVVESISLLLVNLLLSFHLVLFMVRMTAPANDKMIYMNYLNGGL